MFYTKNQSFYSVDHQIIFILTTENNTRYFFFNSLCLIAYEDSEE